MANCNSDGVCCVIRRWDAFELQDIFNHNLDLFFFRATVAGKSLFHLKRCIGEERYSVFFNLIQNHSAGLGDGDGGLQIFEKEKILDRSFVGFIFPN